MPDLYFYREPEDIEKEEQAAALAAAKPEETYPQTSSDWVSAPAEQQVGSTDWGEQPATSTDVSHTYCSFPFGLDLSQLFSTVFSLKSNTNKQNNTINTSDQSVPFQNFPYRTEF